MEWVGLEDAWVLSRMLENYEEAVDEGLREYARFRRARANRLSRAAAVRAEQYFENTRLGRLGRNLNLALSTRFLPEIAMQRIDWLYGHDCIRGFR
jgi:2-polyprenyl-6-methoxyphenol hydroxylase-like FAD-dependent oxidoreductase